MIDSISLISTPPIGLRLVPFDSAHGLPRLMTHNCPPDFLDCYPSCPLPASSRVILGLLLTLSQRPVFYSQLAFYSSLHQSDNYCPRGVEPSPLSSPRQDREQGEACPEILPVRQDPSNKYLTPLRASSYFAAGE